MKVVIEELENYRGRTEQRFLIMQRLKNRNGLNHIFPGKTFTKEDAIRVCESKGWSVEAIGGFYEIV